MEIEQRILCLGARTGLDDSARDELGTLLSGPVDWRRLGEQAGLHEIMPMLLATLRPWQDSAAIPPEWLEQAERRAAATLVRNLTLVDELVRVVETLAGAGIETIPIKGVVLAETVYGSLALRPAADLDVLVRPDDMATARPLLAALGYEQSREPSFAAAHHPFHDAQYYLGESARAVCLELHSALWDSRFFGPDNGLWERAVPAEFHGVETRFLSPEDALLHLAIHRSQSPLRLRFLCDVAELLRHAGDELAWEAVLDRARSVRARTALFSSLVLARDLLGAPVPARSVDGLGIGRLKRRLLAQTCGAPALFRRPPADIAEGQPGLSDRAIRALEQDGALHIAWTLVRALPREARKRRYERRRAIRAARAGVTR